MRAGSITDTVENWNNERHEKERVTETHINEIWAMDLDKQLDQWRVTAGPLNDVTKGLTSGEIARK